MKMRRTIVAVLTASMTAGLGTAAAIPAAADDTKTIYIYQMKTEIQDALEQVCDRFLSGREKTVPECRIVCLDKLQELIFRQCGILL